MQKNNDKRTHEAQGQRSKTIASQNQLFIFLTLIDRPLTFSELLKETGFSRPVLAKHLKVLQKKGSITKDTVKQGETSNSKEIGKVVYRVKTSEIVPLIMKALEHTLKMPNPKWDEELKAELERYYEGIASVVVRQWEKFHSRK
jgi:DNA-binding transcriptional regulator GbsR (MarR family)